MFNRRKFTIRGRSPARVIPQFYRQLIYGVVLLFVLGLLGLGVWKVARLPSLTIQTIEVVGGETVAHESVRSLIEEVLRGSYLRIIPYRFSPLYPAEAVYERVVAEPRIREAELLKVNETTLRVTFSEYQPSALWCATRDEAAECYFVDVEGYAFASAPSLRGGALIRYSFEDETEVREKLVMSRDTLDRVATIARELGERYDFRVQEVVFTKVGDEEYWLKDGSALKVSSAATATEVVADLGALLVADEFSHLKPGNFFYVDLRFKNRVFVNETFPGAVATTSPETATTSADSLSDTP